jgi:hypothetical protein
VGRLHEKGGKQHELPANHNLEAYLGPYIEAAGIREDKKDPSSGRPIAAPARSQKTGCTVLMPGAWCSGAL